MESTDAAGGLLDPDEGVLVGGQVADSVIWTNVSHTGHYPGAADSAWRIDIDRLEAALAHGSVLVISYAAGKTYGTAWLDGWVPVPDSEGNTRVHFTRVRDAGITPECVPNALGLKYEGWIKGGYDKATRNHPVGSPTPPMVCDKCFLTSCDCDDS